MLLDIAFFVFIREDDFTFKKEKIGLVSTLLRPDFYFSSFLSRYKVNHFYRDLRSDTHGSSHRSIKRSVVACIYNTRPPTKPLSCLTFFFFEGNPILFRSYSVPFVSGDGGYSKCKVRSLGINSDFEYYLIQSRI